MSQGTPTLTQIKRTTCSHLRYIQASP